MDSNREAHRETLLDELNDFERKRPNEIPAVLEDYLSLVAKTGDTIFPWSKLKPLLYKKLEMVMGEFYEAFPTDNLPTLPNVEAFKYEAMKSKILEAVDCFHSAPFTIQRLCELVVNPRKHYKRTDKFMRGLEKNILVVSTVEPRSIYHQETSLVNGVLDTTPSSASENQENCAPMVINGNSPFVSLQNRIDSKNNDHVSVPKRKKEDPSCETEEIATDQAEPCLEAKTNLEPDESDEKPSSCLEITESNLPEKECGPEEETSEATFNEGETVTTCEVSTELPTSSTSDLSPQPSESDCPEQSKSEEEPMEQD